MYHRLTLAISSLLLAGCPPIQPAPPVVLVLDAGQPPDDAGPPPVEDAGPPPLEDAGPPDAGPPDDCSAYEFRGVTYNCDEIDRCDLTDLTTGLACCDCDPGFCDADPTCNPPPPEAGPADSCMTCHNGSDFNDYAGPGLSNPHPFGPTLPIACSTCHGGNPNGFGELGSHVPPPPEIGDRQNQQNDPQAAANRRVFSGVDLFPDYGVEIVNGRVTYPPTGGTVYTAAQYIQFINPGDLRIVREGNGCGQCHFDHAQSVSNSLPIGTETGFFSSATSYIGADNAVPENRGLYFDTAADYSYRGTQSTNIDANGELIDPRIGEVARTIAVPEHAGEDGELRNALAGDLANDQFNNAVNAADPIAKNGRVRTGSDLAKLFQTQVSITCGDCHAGSNGANNRYADFRSSGCTVCHMEYSPDGRSRSTDGNVNDFEPLDPDAVADGERAHVDAHQIRSVARILPNGAFVRGISDRACVGCHQGSNRTVLQYWGIRLDQNADLTDGVQYPANPVTFTNTAQDERLYDPAVANNTFNGRNATQYILQEDYDGDHRDDTPADIHYEAGLGCIDCHGSRDVHAGTNNGTADSSDDDFSGRVMSKMDQVVQIRCESCHGKISAYAPTTPCLSYSGDDKECAMDAAGNPLRNTVKDINGNYFLTGRVDGQLHYIPQTRDVVDNNNLTNPLTNRLVYNAKASYAMGRVGGLASDGVGPRQTTPGLVETGFSHTDNMDCISCHASWANQCIGCHLRTQFEAQDLFYSNITGERILMKQQNADFTYITPVPTYLAVNSKNQITQVSAGMKVFYAYIDLNGDTSQVFSFSDRNGNGNNPTLGRNAHPALGNYQMAPHSIRGKVASSTEGPKYCVTCHNTTQGLAAFGADYADFVENYTARNYADLDYDLLQEHIGQNPGNQLNSPFYVHATAGLGSALFFFDKDGCPVNPLDNDDNRFFCNGVSPADRFATDGFTTVAYDTDRFVEVSGVTNVSSLHPLIVDGSGLRDGSNNPQMSGTLGATIINKLTNTNVAQGGKVLDSWIDADGNAQGDAADYIIP